MAAKTHVIMVPFPTQGHVIPLLELAQCLARHGVKITFVNTEIVHQQHFINTPFDRDSVGSQIRFISVPDGLEPEERYIPGKLTETLYEEMPRRIEELVREINASDDQEEIKVTCVVYDQSLGSILKVAKKMGIGSAAFCPAAAALLVLGFNIPKLIEDGVIDNEGTPLKDDPVQFEPGMPIMRPSSDFVWSSMKIASLQKLIFNIMIKNIEATKSVDWHICNSVYDLEPGAFSSNPQIVPIGPLLASNNSSQRENDIIEWLDQQPISSVTYVACGSTGVLDEAQFQELALGLEQTHRPFIWVVRRGTTKGDGEFSECFAKRVSKQGKIADWVPQQKVLSHRSIACFVTHCGWNSTIESVSNGVPMLCWPYFADQFINQSYICDKWRVGLRLERDVTSGIVASEEIERKIDQLLSDNVYRERAVSIKTMVHSSSTSGNSYKNLSDFISWIKRR